MSTKKYKQKLFSDYAANLSIYLPEYSDQFMCPICRRVFSRHDLDGHTPKISLAHAPPKSVGGKPRSLACTDCDNRIGDFDRHVKYEKDSFDKFEEEVTKKILRSPNDKKLEIEIKTKDNTISALYAINKIPPEHFRKKSEEFMKYYPTEACGFSMEDGSPKLDLDKWHTSLLYTAFLVMFSRFGYEYALSQNIESLRKVLNGNEAIGKYRKSIFAVYERSIPGVLSPPIISILTVPADMRCFAIEIPSPRREDASRCIFLPGFGESALESYSKLMKRDPSKFEFEVIPIPFKKLGNNLQKPEFKGFGERLWRKAAIAGIKEDVEANHAQNHTE